ncbi:hypothetical protein CWI37_0409p0020 [Hamiltosporidium tvaerminnensis]|uniref:Uncharacterized protein n=2 Tax=Hamiltosporidium TaxID=1176354 RepID=A0A4Q9LJ99_9MICR|nr:hypothetical protein LUQ84_002593 [Hamiltosporidium tvaerminnensis]TBT98467.1 hypothetical protein CWI36_2377p0010 [Hamiltosporidium magnivora]TBU02817.1 hypothetical protein CWI37_0409p0020 [Hamiltosporidium tvaerminnensis]TBU07585.1 hypothetical protein CWI36_0255p0030 [Hamiltosporidium magnivora]
MTMNENGNLLEINNQLKNINKDNETYGKLIKVKEKILKCYLMHLIVGLEDRELVTDEIFKLNAILQKICILEKKAEKIESEKCEESRENIENKKRICSQEIIKNKSVNSKREKKRKNPKIKSKINAEALFKKTKIEVDKNIDTGSIKSRRIGK